MAFYPRTEAFKNVALGKLRERRMLQIRVR